MPTVLTPIDFNLSPVPVNLCMTRRDSFPFGFVLSQGGAVIDLTGGSFAFNVNAAPDGSGSAIFAIANSNTLAADGIVTFTPSVLNTTQVVGTYFYEVAWTDATANIRTVINGTFRIDPEVLTA